ncbi:hypothetical protein [Flavobacterium terrisoli]|uniref:hypothetical protein n=1 Tax=Flavobacterium terrisoli TaxID=3242195 RepID=UPI002542C69E|nr:hypothetical protein [Flavobacterium buctense]
MKIVKIIFLLFLFFAIDVNAQYGYGNGYRTSAGPGVIRDNRTPTTEQTPKEPSPAEIEKNRVEKIEIYMSHLKSDLSLDELQYIAFKNELISTSKRMDIVSKSDYSDDEKNAEMRSIQEKLEKTLMSYLNPAQKEKYQLLKIQKPEKKDEKKRKKNRDNPEENKETETKTETNN